MIKNHSHSMFQVLKLFAVNALDVRVLYLVILDQGEQDVGSQVLTLQIKALSHLALLQRLVNATNVLPQG
jgi:hypothetical protein